MPRFFSKCFLPLGLALFALCHSLNAQIPGPTPEHETLKRYVGKWDFILKSGDGTESKGTSEYKLECSDLWLVSDFRTDFGGVPFQGRGLDGYDPQKKKYISIWVDSLSHTPMSFSGDYDKTGKVLTMVAEAPNPSTGEMATWKSTTEFISDDEHRFEMFIQIKEGPQLRLMSVTYKRKK